MGRGKRPPIVGRRCGYLGLQWPDVDWKSQRVTIQRSVKRRKGGEWYTTPPKSEKSVRSIALMPDFVKDLEDHRRRQLEMRLKAGTTWSDHGFIFTDEAGDPLKIDAVRRVHKQICAEAGLPVTFKLKVSPYSCESVLLNAGVSLRSQGKLTDLPNPFRREKCKVSGKTCVMARVC